MTAQSDYSFYDTQFQKRFGLPCLETILLRFRCSFGRSRGSLEVTDTHLAYHGSKGVKWILSLSTVRCIQKAGPDTILLCSSSRDYHIFHVKRCDRMVRLLRTLWDPRKAESESREACSTVLKNQLALFDSYSPVLDTVLPIPYCTLFQTNNRLERLLTRYIESTRFYHSLLESGGDFGIQVGRWQQKEGKCCPEKRREVQFQHVYSLFKKQVPCCSSGFRSSIGVIRQHQCMVHHERAQMIVITIQHTVSNIPIYGTLRLMNHWIIEKAQADSVRIRISYNIEGMQGIALATVCLGGESDA